MPNPVPQPSLSDFLKNFIPAGGTFQMGSPKEEIGRGDDEGPRGAFVSNFYIAKYDVTVADFMQFRKATGYDYDTITNKPAWGWIPNNPMVNVD